MYIQNPKISVIIPTYNRARLLPRAIKSVLDQTYKDFEIIIVDDGSTDDTEEVIKNCEDERIRYVRHNKNKGASAARNTGIKLAKGKYIAFQDSDDEWFPDKLERQMEVFGNAPSEVGIVYSGFYMIEGDKKKYIPSNHVVQKEENIHDELLKDNFVGTPTVLIKKECFESIKYFDEDLPSLEDWDLWIEFSKYYTFKYIDAPLLRCYFTPNSVNFNSKNRLKASEIILTNHLNDFSKNKKILSDHYFRMAVEFFAIDDFKNGRRYVIKSVKTNYLNIKAVLCLFILPFGQKTYFKLKSISDKC